jgi:hypothetical protein
MLQFSAKGEENHEAAPFAARAQEPGHVHRLDLVSQSYNGCFTDDIQSKGYIKARTSRLIAAKLGARRRELQYGDLIKDSVYES